jgi:hypothetical protein
MACGVSRLSLVTTIRLGDDADNVCDEGEKQVIVGYGRGGLAMLDANTGEKREDSRAVEGQ